MAAAVISLYNHGLFIAEPTMPDIIKTTPWPRCALLLLNSLLGLQIIVGCAARVTSGQAPDYAASPQCADGVFHNQPGFSGMAGAGSWQAGLCTLFRRKVGKVPEDVIPVQPLSAQTLNGLSDSANHVIRLGHSSVLLKLQSKYSHFIPGARRSMPSPD